MVGDNRSLNVNDSACFLYLIYVREQLDLTWLHRFQHFILCRKFSVTMPVTNVKVRCVKYYGTGECLAVRLSIFDFGSCKSCFFITLFRHCQTLPIPLK